ncbi:MAG: right-handed parallel beta-helix repeat-containing protein, partial [Gammaproteobacteria bacterium]
MLISTSGEKLRTFILLSLFVFQPTLVNATTYYVAPNGSNSSTGTQAQPFATLQKAHDVAVAGDTIYLRGGTYYPSAQTKITRSGSSGNYIKVWAYPGERPVIDAINHNSGSSMYMIRMTNASWWYIKGLELKNGAIGGIHAVGSSNNNIFENNNIHHCGRLLAGGGTGAIAIYGTSANNTVLNNDAHDNDAALGNGGAADGILIVTTGRGNVIRGNRFWRNSDDGIDMWNAAPALIENNWSWENGYKGDALTPRGNGNGFKLGGTGPNDGGHTLKNNVSWGNRTFGFHDNQGDLPMTLYNNTAWDNPKGNFKFSRPSTFRNSSSFGLLGRITGSDTFNSWTLGVTVSAADFSSLNDTIARGPRNADGSLPASNFLRLVAGSDLIDRGVNVGITYVGSAPDLGAYEYGASGSPAPPPLPPPPPAPSSSCTQTPLTVSSAFSDGGFAYVIIRSFGTPADNSANRKRSVLKLFENSLELGPAHSVHANIRNLGQGRFSHWSSTTGTGEALRFAASDNTDPRTNGRSYTYCVPGPAPDTTPPTVSLTAPASGATVSGTAVTVSADAADNAGVAGVQFKLDGANYGA